MPHDTRSSHKRDSAQTRACLLILIGAALWSGRPALAYPTSLDLIPTADVLDRGVARFEVEADGAHTPFTGDADVYLLAQYGLTGRLEVGVDCFGLAGGSRLQPNAKWQFVPEGRGVPAMAVGVTDLGRMGVFSQWYLALAKDVGPVRLHAGCLTDNAFRGLFGVEYPVTDHTEVLADWITGADGYSSLGLWQELGHGLSVTGYYAHRNTRDDGDFVGLDLSWEISFRHSPPSPEK